MLELTAYGSSSRSGMSRLVGANSDISKLVGMASATAIPKRVVVIGAGWAGLVAAKTYVDIYLLVSHLM